ncbi:MAG: hypothetical protein ACO3UU_13000 [Minisyncoccia bacterium]
MICEFVFVVIVQGEPHYVGTFENCDYAEQYVREYYPTFDSGCQHRDYIYLPKDLREKHIIYKDKAFVKLEGD